MPEPDSPAVPRDPEHPVFAERLWPSWWVFAATALVIPASLLVFLPISVIAGIGVAAGLYAGVVAVLLLTTPRIAVDRWELRAGRARLPRAVVRSAEGYEGAEAIAERGTRLDARAWLLLRGWIRPVVRVELDDPEDPTPYWLLSTRRPTELVAALRSGPA